MPCAGTMAGKRHGKDCWRSVQELGRKLHNKEGAKDGTGKAKKDFG